MVKPSFTALKGASRALGLRSIAQDLGLDLRVNIFSDSAAARGIVKRTGLGKVRHIDVQELWVQEALKDGRFGLNTIPGSDNPADILTKHLDGLALLRHCQAVNLNSRMGRSALAPRISGIDAGELATRPKGAVAEEECESYRCYRTRDPLAFGSSAT